MGQCIACGKVQYGIGRDTRIYRENICPPREGPSQVILPHHLLCVDCCWCLNFGGTMINRRKDLKLYQNINRIMENELFLILKKASRHLRAYDTEDPHEQYQEMDEHLARLRAFQSAEGVPPRRVHSVSNTPAVAAVAPAQLAPASRLQRFATFLGFQRSIQK